MEIVFEIVTELFLEIFCEGFVALFSSFLPSGQMSPRAIKIVKAVLAVVTAVLLVLLLLGVLLLIETAGRSVLGWVFVSLGVLYVVVSVALMIYKKTR